tara:strand:+ start:458 stop:2074 length:1617 start_codon:yes stop_codon:yes gene_type:complete
MALSDTKPWWQGSFGYQIYIRSFADSNDDGFGDFQGIRSKLPYLKDLGVDFVWITPFYPSPMADWGYDVAEYCDIDPTFGTLDDFDSLVEQAHGNGIKIVADLVPNHTSDQHKWFKEAKKGPDNEFRDYYIWKDPAPGGGPPNNWVAYFGGPAWTFDETSGQYYMHLFLPEQPDLNWRNPKIPEEFDQILRFWLERGVDGFRIDVAGGLMKDEQFRSNPEITPWDPEGDRWEQFESFEHRYDIFQKDNHEIFRRWRSIFDEYGAYLHGETYTLEPAGLAELLPGDGLHGGFWFEPMHIEWDPSEIRRSVVEVSELVGESILWAAGSHDMPRSPTRFVPQQETSTRPNNNDIGRSRTLALNVLFSFLPGVPVIYQGEELGLIDGDVPEEHKLDPVALNDNQFGGRDGCRTPMPWSSGKNNGFSETKPWLVSEQRDEAETAEAQIDKPGSWHSFYKELLYTRRSLPDITGLDVTWLDSGQGSVIWYERGPVGVVVNTSSETESIKLSLDSEIVFQTSQVEILESGEVIVSGVGALVYLRD